VQNSCFFEKEWRSQENYSISNPSYLPAINNDLHLPALYVGIDGASITRQLLDMNCQSAMLMISAYSDPVGVIEYAIAQGYQEVDFVTSPMTFGYYILFPESK
jgi:hypothetical protein